MNVIDEEVNNPPQVTVIYPNGGEELSGNINIRWRATDQDNDELTINIEYSNNNGRNWYFIYNNLRNDGVESWNTNNYPNGEYLIKVTASDGEITVSDISNGIFTIGNNGDNPNLPNAYITSPRSGDYNINDVIQFRGYGEDADNDRIINYKWNLGNNVIRNEQNFEHFYNEIGNYDITFEVQDEHGAWSAPARVNVNIIEGEIPNREPNIPSNPHPENNAINVPIEIMLRWDGGDPDGDFIMYDVYLNNQLACRNSRETFCYLIKNLNYNTVYNWQVVASDGELISRSSVWSFRTVVESAPVNLPPFVNIKKPGEGITINDVYNIEWDSHDVDGNIVNTRIYYKRSSIIPFIGGLFDLFNNYRLLVDLGDSAQKKYNWDTLRHYDGTYSLRIIVTDDDNLPGEDIVRIFRIKNTAELNHAPRITSEPVTKIKVNTRYVYDVNAVDVDGNSIIYSLLNAPEGMSIDFNTGVITWLPNNIGNYGVAVKATDNYGLFSIQEFTINVLPEESIVPKEESREVHEFSISNVILHQDNNYINIYVQIMNKGNQDEKIQLRAININTGEIIYDSFLIENGDGYWRILRLSKPEINGIYTIAVYGNSNNYKDILYRDINVTTAKFINRF